MRFGGLAAVTIFFIAVIPIMAPNVSADGMSFYKPNYDQWSLLDEDTQFAVINFDRGQENLLLQISVSKTDLSRASEMLWLFPVPAPANKTEIGIFPNFAPLGGYFLNQHAISAVRENFFWIYSTQIYGIPIAFGTIFTLNQKQPDLPLLSRGSGAGAVGVDVFQRVEQSGMVTEVVDSGSASALSTYLDTYGVTLPTASEPIVQDCADEGFAFVVSRIIDVEAFTANATESRGFSGLVYGMSVEIAFPSQSVFYPMRLSSVYGATEIPIVLQIIGDVTPSSGMMEGVPMDYYYCRDSSYRVSQGMEWFFAEQARSGQLRGSFVHDLDYTLVTVHTKASQMTYDLSFEDRSASASKLKFIIANAWILMIGLFVGLSIASSLVAGSFVYRAYRPRRGRFALLGLANSTTLIGLYFIARHLRIDETFTAPAKRTPIKLWKSYVGLFSVTFFGLGILSNIIISYIIL